MSLYLPTRRFQIYQIFAPNTNVGKTIISAGLLNAFSKSPSPLSNKYNRSGNSSKADAHNSFEKLFYVKPVQTGYPADSDARFVKDCLDRGQQIQYKTLYEYEQPVSPHLAIGNNKAPSDNEVLENVKASIVECKRVARNNGLLILETAGGVNSPIMSGTPQITFYRPLRLPTIVIGDSKLGGISTTLSALESLHVRGYDVLSILFLTKPDKFGDSNFAYFRSLTESLNSHLRLPYRIPIFGISSPPEKKESRQQDLIDLKNYFKDTESEYDDIIKELRRWYNDRFDRLEEMEEKTKKVVWWPFTQHQNVEKVTVIDSAHEDFFVTYRKDGGEKTRVGEKISSDSDAKHGKRGGDFKELFDACASWWTQGLGHGSQRLSLASAYAAGRYGHVMFPECTHEPALAISESLLSTVGRPWADRVFFSDNGSTAMEVALKMGLRAFEAEMEDRSGVTKSEGNEEDNAEAERNGEHLEVLGLNGSYHGDTIGAMDACGPNVFNEQVGWYKPRGYWFDPPMVLMKDGVYGVHIPPSFTLTSTAASSPISSIANSQRFTSLSAVFSQTRDSSALADFYKSHIMSTFHQLSSSGRTFGSLVMEPVVMGAGGMIFVDPVFQRCLVDCARSHDWGRKKRQYQTGKWKGLPVIFDEVYTGLWRLGRMSGAEMLGVNPDIAAYAKLLTGGLLPLAVTLASENIFSSFSTPHKTDALLHGHSYTAHPIGCWVAKTCLDEYAIMNKSDGSWSEHKREWIDGDGDNNWSMWSVKTVDHISRLQSVKGVFALGTLLSVHLESSSSNQGYASNVAKDLIKHLRSHSHDTISSDISNVNNEYGIFARPLGDVVYFMTSLITNRAIVNDIERMIVKALESL